MKNTGNIHVGTSGWNYNHWKGHFYPKDLSQKKWLEFYMKKFRTVEINNSFYQLPEKTTFENWRDTVPEEFVFSVKASRYITQMKKLKEPKEPLQRFFNRAKVLGHTLGPILFQLPPRWKCNYERLKSFLNILPDEFRYTFEFRDPSWWNDQVYETLSKHNAAFCIFELSGNLTPKEVTADFVYIRLHGLGSAYQGQYDAQTLAGWAGAIASWRSKKKDIYCYFDNDQYGYAAEAAMKLQEMMGK